MHDSKKPPGSGRSTFELIDTFTFFKILDLQRSMIILDIGSGIGDYTIPIAESVGHEGRVYAVDAWEEGLARIKERASEKSLMNIDTVLADVNRGIPLDDGMFDLCLMACVLHDLLRDASGETVLREVSRVLKPGGRLAVLEFKKSDDGPGPPVHVRITAGDVQRLLSPLKFDIQSISDTGKYHYLLIASSTG